MDRKRYEHGLEIRRDVLGAEYVERSLANADELGADFQELVTEYCWGAVWGRDGLPRKLRSLVNVAMLAALNRPDELELHLAGAVRNGCTPAEIREVLLQVTVYCGVPAGVDGFRAARRVLAETAPSAAGEAANPQADGETVRRLAAQARLGLDADDLGAHVERLKEFSAWIDEWADEPLPFNFEDGEFSYTPVLAQFRPRATQPGGCGEQPADEEANRER